MSGKKKIDGANVVSKNWGGSRPNGGRPRLYKSKYEANRANNLDYRVVYKLSNNYVGSTNNLYLRMAKHKSVGNPVDNYEVLFASYDKAEANKVERHYHSIGFNGRSGGFKNNI